MTVGKTARTPLHELASFLGISEGYTDVDGRYRQADDATLAAIAASLGEPVGGSDKAVFTRLQDLRELKNRRLIEPVVVHREGSSCEFVVNVKEGDPLEQVGVLLELEDGHTRGWKLSDLPFRESGQQTPGMSSVRVRIPSEIEELPFGYHHLEVEIRTRSARALLICAPSHCPAPLRTWGAFIPLYALRRDLGDARQWGTGSFSDLSELTHWLRSRGGTFVGTLPILAAFVDDTGTYQGPYLPASKLAWNEAFVDIESLPELKSEGHFGEEARRWLRPAAATIGSGSLQRADLAETLRSKRPILELLASSIWESDSAQRGRLDAYLRARPHLHQYAMFRSASETLGSRWQAWPGSTPREVPRGSVDEDAVRYHLYAQFAADRQLDTLGDDLYLDLPVGAHPSGFDTWWEPKSFASSVSGGAPPDDFFSAGQNWGFRPLHPENIRAEEYRYVISYLRHLMSHAQAIRIDHVMGLHRLWWVPDGMDADKGAYVRYREEELRALVVLEAYRSGTVVAGEDLGTVPPEVRAAMVDDGMLSSFVYQFDSSVEEPLPHPRRLTLASLGTHDLPTFRSYWNGWDINRASANQETTDSQKAEHSEATAGRAEWRQSVRWALGMDAPPDDETGEVREALRGLLSYLAASPAALVMVDLEDLMMETARQNTPGTAISEGNFSRRAEFTLEAMTRDPYVVDVLTRMATARTESEPEELR